MSLAKVVGDLEFKIDGVWYEGTGFLVGPNDLLTAAHNVHDGDKFISNSIVVYFDGKAYSAKVTWMTVPGSYTHSSDWADDMALLTLSEPIGNTLGWMGMRSADHPNYLNLAGYSLSKWPYDGDTLQADYVYATYQTGSGVITYTSYDIHGGASGGPAYTYYGGNERYAVGIHVAGSPSKPIGNTANLLTADDIELIKKWINNNGDGVNPVIIGTDTDDNIFGYDTYNELYGKKSNDNIYGGGGTDIIFGGSGQDHIYGGTGSDIINGGKGRDALTGGSEGDRFKFADQLKRSNVDDITDFEVNNDTILLDKSVFKRIGARLSKKEFEIGKKADDKKDRIIYDDKNGKLYHDADGNKSGKKKLFATLDKNLVLDNDDFDMIA
ncbi:MAG: trypsin-like peptidase domain-containing protein [Bauldia sp.]|nr:trypsin-like peptidase domain-containing protein [Bauldia sp.]